MEALITDIVKVTKSRKPGLTGRRGTLRERILQTEDMGPVEIGQRIKVTGEGTVTVTNVRSYTHKNVRFQEVEFTVLASE